MKKVKMVLRLIVMVLLLFLAAFGIGLTGNFLNNNRERYMNNEIRSEIVEKRDDEEDEEMSQQ